MNLCCCCLNSENVTKSINDIAPSNLSYYKKLTNYYPDKVTHVNSLSIKIGCYKVVN